MHKSDFKKPGVRQSHGARWYKNHGSTYVTQSDKVGLTAEKYTCSYLRVLSEYCLFYSIP